MLQLTTYLGGFQICPVLFDNWLFLTIFLFPPKKKREEQKENEVAKPVLNHFFRIDSKFTPIKKKFILVINFSFMESSERFRIHLNQGFGFVIFYQTDPDPLGMDPPENISTTLLIIRFFN